MPVWVSNERDRLRNVLYFSGSKKRLLGVDERDSIKSRDVRWQHDREFVPWNSFPKGNPPDVTMRHTGSHRLAIKAIRQVDVISIESMASYFRNSFFPPDVLPDGFKLAHAEPARRASDSARTSAP